MCLLIPSLLVNTREEFERRLRLVEHGAELMHVDVLDGTLFPATSWHDAAAVGGMDTPAHYELHLMVDDPLPVVEAWKRQVPNLRRAIVHAEAPHPTDALVEQLKQWGLEAGVALNPETPLEDVQHLLAVLDQLTVMGVHPGASGQAFLGEPILEKIRAAKHARPDLPVEMDGGATEELLPALVQAGCNRIVAANAVFGAADPADALRRLVHLATAARL